MSFFSFLEITFLTSEDGRCPRSVISVVGFVAGNPPGSAYRQCIRLVRHVLSSFWRARLGPPALAAPRVVCWGQ
ncbi:hypothetical protein Y032_0058g2861 [Ancylostoma ceylanicum]|uniref:Uncharacterized protein n=1 Tax=Ancylostoma ceylanicum TaxID=53326 RepID=A0A016U3I7_9BILA|nr:hypothetical protein Y032_0058g2861 [Ancylostoma ceylanicum]